MISVWLTLVIHQSRLGGPPYSCASSFCWNFDIPSTPTTWSDVGGIVSYFTPSSDVCLRLTDTDKDTIARVGLPARLLVFWCVFSLTSSLCSYRSKRFGPSFAIQKVYFVSSHFISPTNYEPRLLPIYISVGDVPTFLSRYCCLIYCSLENDVTLISSGYMSTWSYYRREIQYVQLLLTERQLRTAGCTRTLYDLSFAFADHVQHCDIWLINWRSKI